MPEMLYYYASMNLILVTASMKRTNLLIHFNHFWYYIIAPKCTLNCNDYMHLF